MSNVFVDGFVYSNITFKYNGVDVALSNNYLNQWTYQATIDGKFFRVGYFYDYFEAEKSVKKLIDLILSTKDTGK